MSHKRKKKRSSETAPPNIVLPPRPGAPRWLVAVLIVGVLAGGGILLYEYLSPPRIPPEMVGRWRVLEGYRDQNATIEFFSDGRMVARVPGPDGEDGTVKARVEVDGDNLKLIYTDQNTNRSSTGTQKILTLTETEIVTVDANGVTVRMQRIR